jgi:hypothetical protein
MEPDLVAGAHALDMRDMATMATMATMGGHRAGAGRRSGLGDRSDRVAVGDEIAGAAAVTMSDCVDYVVPGARIGAKNLPRRATRCHFAGDDRGQPEGP